MDHKVSRRYFSVIVGAGCNARCPFCISPAAMKNAADLHESVATEAVEVAHDFGCTVASVSGGGEPLLLARKDLEQWELVTGAIAGFAKRDLHSNFSFDPRVGLERFTHLTVSLWGHRETTRRYLGRDFHDRVVKRLLDRPDHLDLRLSAVAGSDWLKGPESLVEYARFARNLGASQVTVREMQPSGQGDLEWMSSRRIDVSKIERTLEGSGELIRVSPNGSKIYSVEGIEVCAYRYPADAEDRDFVYLRPDRNGNYGTFLDFDNDEIKP